MIHICLSTIVRSIQRPLVTTCLYKRWSTAANFKPLSFVIVIRGENDIWPDNERI